MPDQPSDARPPQTRADLRAARGAPASEGDIAAATATTPPVAAAHSETAIEPDDRALADEALDDHALADEALDDQALDRHDAVTPHVRRTDWRLGGRTVLRWREWLVAGALVSLGVAILAGALINALWQSPWAAASASALLWASMLVPTVWALSLSRPVGLLRFRAVDLLYGVVLGGMLRLIHGGIQQVVDGVAGFPSYPLIDGQLGDQWLTDAIAVMAIAPVVEEFFFRAVILVSLYTILRRPLGGVTAGVIAVVASAVVFVLVHGMTLGVAPDRLIATFVLGLVCGTLVMTTGRIWGAVLVHAVFNATYVALALVGTYLV